MVGSRRAKFKPESIALVREKTDIVELIGERTELEASGQNSYFGPCPFHEERTGSFHVSPNEGMYHCFGCEASGDAIKFLMDLDGLSFPEAVSALAERAGLELESEAEDPEVIARREAARRQYALLERVAAFYSRCLRTSQDAAPARRYLVQRGFDRDILRDWRVGYAPAGRAVVDAARAAGVTEDDLLTAGLAARNEGTGDLYDRFRDRIMFPVTDARGTVVGFGGRALGDFKPKYLASPSSDIYRKREALFGIDWALQPARRAGCLYVVEGQLDCLAVHQAGVANCVGVMGTAFTREHLEAIEAILPACRLILCLDGDNAGDGSLRRIERLTSGRRCELRTVTFPSGSDPADILRSGGAGQLRQYLLSHTLLVHHPPYLEVNEEGADGGRTGQTV